MNRLEQLHGCGPTQSGTEELVAKEQQVQVLLRLGDEAAEKLHPESAQSLEMALDQMALVIAMVIGAADRLESAGIDQRQAYAFLAEHMKDVVSFYQLFASAPSQANSDEDCPF